MKMMAKAALGALALAMAAMAAVPAGAATVTVTTTTRTVHAMPGACLRAPDFRPAFCFHRGFFARELRREAMLRQMRHDRHEAMRQAYLEHRFERSY